MKKELRVMIVPDIHCRYEMIEEARNKIEEDNCDIAVFLGDYADSFNHKDIDMLHTMNLLIGLKVDYPDKVILLLGNHDLPYYTNGQCRCSGFRAQLLAQMYHIYQEHKDKFQVAYQLDKYLFTHAGVTNKWYNWKKEVLERYAKKKDNIAEQLNKVLLTRDWQLLYDVGPLRGGMRYEKGGPLWADKRESDDDFLAGYHQYVGHTPIKYVQSEEEPATFSSITYLDVGADEPFMIITIPWQTSIQSLSETSKAKEEQ